MPPTLRDFGALHNAPRHPYSGCSPRCTQELVVQAVGWGKAAAASLRRPDALDDLAPRGESPVRAVAGLAIIAPRATGWQSALDPPASKKIPTSFALHLANGVIAAPPTLQKPDPTSLLRR